MPGLFWLFFSEWFEVVSACAIKVFLCDYNYIQMVADTNIARLI